MTHEEKKALRKVNRAAIREIVTFLVDLARRTDPQIFQGHLLAGVLANVVSNLPDDYFNAFAKKAVPCQRAGCSCHLHFAALLEHVRGLRECSVNHGQRSVAE